MSESEHLKSDEDVEAILRLAVRRTDSSSGELRERMQAAASELGISEEQLQRAEEQYKREIEDEQLGKVAEEEDHQLWRIFRRQQYHEFLTHLAVYAAVNTGLMGLDIVQGGGVQWAFFPLIGWGIAVLIHLGTLIAPHSEENSDEFEKFKAKRAKRARKYRERRMKVASSMDDEVLELVLEGRKIEAIKLVRESTGMGLKEAKAYVEQPKFQL